MSIRWIWTGALVLALAGCGEASEETVSADEEPTVAEAEPAAHANAPDPHAADPHAADPHAAGPHGGPHETGGRELSPGETLMPEALEGTVRETMNSGGYTYMRIENGAINVWVAAMQLDVEVGDRVTVTGGSMMQGFRSRTLDRTFDAIVFASRAQVAGAGDAPAPGDQALPPGHPDLADG